MGSRKVDRVIISKNRWEQRSKKDKPPFWKGKSELTISSALGLLAALIGTTATLLAAWGYLRKQRPSKKELSRVTLTIIIIMVAILGMAVFISRATISVNGQQTIPVPPISGPDFPTPVGITPTSIPTPTSTPTPATSPTSSSSPTPFLSPTVPPSPTTSSLTPTPTHGGGR